MTKVSEFLTTIRGFARLFRRNEDGSFVIFTLFILVVMVLIGGLAIDVMRYENLRTTMQNTVDRAVLAAADRDQRVTPQAVVDDYILKAGMESDGYTVDVVETRAGNVVTSRQVTVEASATLGTKFMHLMGTPTIVVPAASSAEEGINRIEISLVIDVSGSMGENSKLLNMQNAAKTFVTEVLTDIEPGQVSINLIPYSAQVNAGPLLLSQFTHTADHNYSHCIHFNGNDFNSMGISPTTTLQQAGHFDPWSNHRRGTFATMAANGQTPSWVCRTDPGFQITPWSNSINDLHAQIDSLTARGNTSIDVAVKWGAALLDPSTRPVFNNLLSNGHLSNDFTPGRPYVHDPDDDVLKFIVVMTDGINTTQYYLRDAYRSGMSGVWIDPDTGRYSVESEEPGDYDGDGRWGEDYWWARNRNEGSYNQFWRNNIYDVGTTGNAVELTWPELWNQMSLSHRAYTHYYAQFWDADDYWQNYTSGSNAPRRSVGASTKDTRLNNVCTASKDEDVIIFSIGFEVTDASAAVMQNCASSANHFFRVEGLEIEYAFEAIANQINQLKLTQ